MNNNFNNIFRNYNATQYVAAVFSNGISSKKLGHKEVAIKD